MNVTSWLLWGFIATLILTSIMAGCQGLGLTRMSVPYMVGSIFTPNRDRAKLVGFVGHLINGWVFSLLYVLAFQSLHRATWWLGAAIGLLQAAFVLSAGMNILPALHPRMASEQQGPTVTHQLEPPGFFASNYGLATPLVSLVAHAVYGAILGGFYALR